MGSWFKLGAWFKFSSAGIFTAFCAVSLLLSMAVAVAQTNMPISATGLVNEANIRDKFGSDCKWVSACDTLIYIDCNSAADGPAYFVQKDTLNVVANAGGSCMAPGAKDCGTPAIWTCGDPNVPTSYDNPARPVPEQPAGQPNAEPPKSGERFKE